MLKRFCPTFCDGSLREELKTTALAFLILTVIGFAGAYLFPAVFEGILSSFAQMVEELDAENSSNAELFVTLFANNVVASALSMLYGVIPFLYLSAISLGTNALLIGAFGALCQQNGFGLFRYFVGIAPHGIFELPALVIACALGLLLCKTGTARLRRRGEACRFLPRLRDCFRAFLILVLPLLLLAALTETYLTPLLLNLVI